MRSRGYAGKLLPNQEYFRYLYREDDPYETALYGLVSSYAASFEASNFDLDTPSDVDLEEMSTPPYELAFLNALIQLVRARSVLEIGTFVGHSTMQFARMVGDAGHVTTIEIFKDFAEIARANFRRNGLESRISLIEGEAGEILGSLPRNAFDLIFIDGGKENYLEYAIKCFDLLTDKGIIVIDDVFFHGDVFNNEILTEKGSGCKKVLDYFKANGRFEKLLLPMGNGILVLFNQRAGDAG